MGSCVGALDGFFVGALETEGRFVGIAIGSDDGCANDCEGAQLTVGAGIGENGSLGSLAQYS